MTLQIVLLYTFSALISGAIGALIGQRRRRTGAGFWWGFLLGPIGWLVVALGPALGPKCVNCGSPRSTSKICFRCGRNAYGA